MKSIIDKPSDVTRIWTPSNIITLLRICLVPVFIVALLSPWPEWFGVINIISNPMKAVLAALVFIIISCTDWVDGYLARSRGEVTDLGKFLDPLADKILVTAALIALVELQAIPSWPVLIILCREFIVSGIRMLAASKGFVIAASWYGKAKTVFQIIAVVMFLVKDYVIQYSDKPAIENPFYIAAWAVMIVALVLTILSMLDYIAKAKPILWSNGSGAKGASDEFEDSGTKAFISGERDNAKQLIDLLKGNKLTICTAESLTGGMIAAILTSVPGSSEVVKGAFVTYAISSKHELLGVNDTLLESNGAVDPEVAKEMAEYAAQKLNCSFSISATGIAGPSGAEPGKPVGTVFVGIFYNGKTSISECHFDGDRDSIREQTASFAISESIKALKIK